MSPPSPVAEPPVVGDPRRVRVRHPANIPAFALAELKGRQPLFVYITYSPG
jgi:hypothetical protein